MIAWAKNFNLAEERLGTRFFLRQMTFFFFDKPGIRFVVDKYTDRGKWMDGWESRRKRIEGLDWCDIIRRKRGYTGFDIDTNHF